MKTSTKGKTIFREPRQPEARIANATACNQERDDGRRQGPCECAEMAADAAHAAETSVDLRCGCGALLGRRSGDQIELLCRRCKRRIVLVVKGIHMPA